MRKLFSLLNLILCFELIVGPMAPNLSLMSVAQAQSCPAGLQMDNVLNRCLSTAEAANVMNATASCASGDKACYKANATKAFQEKVSAGDAPERVEDQGMIGTVASAAAVAGPITIAVAGMSQLKTPCASYSFYAMVAGSLAIVIGDNLANFMHEGRLKKIKEEWGKVINPEQAAGNKDLERQANAEGQSQAFEMLARAEESLAKAANMKKIFFYVGALAFGVSAALSITEYMTQNALYAKVAATTSNPPLNAAAVTESTAHKTKTTCAPVASNDQKKNKESLYAYYTEGKSIEFGLERQFKYNLAHSQDLVSFVINKEEMDSKISSATIDRYLEMKEILKDTEPQDPSIFQMFKSTTMLVMNNLNPMSNANAEAEAPNDQAKVKEVETNAAKAYKDEEAKGINWAGLGIGVAAGVAAGIVMRKKMITPMMRSIFSGVMMGMSIMMAMHAGKQAEAATKRAALLRKMRDEFATASGALNSCLAADRNDPNKPTCYCYTPENGRNTNRTNSQVCQSLWGTANLTPGNYNGSGDTNYKVCINSSNAADPTCACRATNTCMKAGLGGMQGIGTGTMSMLGQSISPLNQLANGSISAANLNGASLANQASKLSDLIKKMENNKALGDYNKNKKKASQDLMKQLTKASAGLGTSGLLGSSGSSSMPSSPKEAALMLEKEIENATPSSISGGDTIAAPVNQPSKEDLEFGMTADQMNVQENQIAEVMKENLDYGGNDISQSTTNIFILLSIRYQRSGMRRLFDEKGTSKADTPSQSEISQK